MKVGDPEASGTAPSDKPVSSTTEQPSHPGAPDTNPVSVDDPENSSVPRVIVPDPNTSTSTPAPMPVDQTVTMSPVTPITSTSTTPATAPVVSLGQNPDLGSLQAQIGDQSMARLAQSLAATQAGGDPHGGSFARVMEGLKEVCGLMTAGFQHACLDMEAIVQKTLEEATQLNRDFTATAAQDLNLWTAALQPVLDSAGVPAANMEVRQRHARQTGQEISDRILSHPSQMTGSQPGQEGLVRTALLESFTLVDMQCASVWNEVADQVPKIMIRHIPAGQAGVFLTAVYQLLCSQHQGIMAMVVAQAGIPVHLGIHN